MKKYRITDSANANHKWTNQKSISHPPTMDEGLAQAGKCRKKIERKQKAQQRNKKIWNYCKTENTNIFIP